MRVPNVCITSDDHGQPNFNVNTPGTLRQIPARIAHVQPQQYPHEVRRMKASLPLCEGGLGLRSAMRSRPAAHWASWADALKMIKQRHPGVANMIISSLARHEKCSSIQSLLMCVDALEAAGFEVPSWEHLVEGRRPKGTSEDDPCQATHWMAEASRDVPREAVSVKGRVA